MPTNLTKEMKQKIFLSFMLLTILLYTYFMLLLGPLTNQRAIYQDSIDRYTQAVASAKKQITRTKALEANAPVHRLTSKQLEAMVPDGSPVAWFPTRISDIFRQHGVDRAVTRLTTEAKTAPEVGALHRTSWGVDVEQAGFAQLGGAVSDFENQELLAEITNLQIDTLRENMERQHITMMVSNLVKP